MAQIQTHDAAALADRLSGNSEWHAGINLCADRMRQEHFVSGNKNVSFQDVHDDAKRLCPPGSQASWCGLPGVGCDAGSRLQLMFGGSEVHGVHCKSIL